MTLTPSEFSDFVAAFILDKMINPDEVVIENDDFTKLIKKVAGQGAKPLFTKYYLDMSADDRLNYKRFKDTLEPGSNRKSVVEVRPKKIEIKKDSGLTDVARNAIKKLLLQNTTEENANILLEKYKEEILNG